MSRQLAIDTIWMRPGARYAHTEYSLGYHSEYIDRVFGADTPEGAKLPHFAMDVVRRYEQG
ncbi:MAG: hypothetical protein QF773_00120 [Lentisphaeria bacterium]|jgi:hypothetical protein|nr:hypothetical protein [Lentisphaeria bacterium]